MNGNEKNIGRRALRESLNLWPALDAGLVALPLKITKPLALRVIIV